MEVHLLEDIEASDHKPVTLVQIRDKSSKLAALLTIVNHP